MNACNPNGLLDALVSKLNLKNDAALSRFLEVAPPVISKIRHNRLPIGDSMIIRLLDRDIMTLQEIRAFVPSPYTGAA